MKIPILLTLKMNNNVKCIFQISKFLINTIRGWFQRKRKCVAIYRNMVTNPPITKMLNLATVLLLVHLYRF